MGDLLLCLKGDTDLGPSKPLPPRNQLEPGRRTPQAWATAHQDFFHSSVECLAFDLSSLVGTVGYEVGMLSLILNHLCPWKPEALGPVRMSGIPESEDDVCVVGCACARVCGRQRAGVWS